MSKKMSKIVDKLGEINICNDWGITEDGHPFFSVHTAQPRSCLPALVRVYVKGRKFKDTPWYDNGGKSFSYSSKEGRDNAIKEALVFVEKLFPGMKMVKSPFGRLSWVSEEDLKQKLVQADEKRED
jgi:hypothetical protein